MYKCLGELYWTPAIALYIYIYESVLVSRIYEHHVNLYDSGDSTEKGVSTRIY